MKVQVNTPQGLKTIGQIVEEPGGIVFEKKVSKAKHLLKVADAWGVQLEVLQNHTNLSLIRLQEVESGAIYEMPVHRFLRLSFERDFGHGRQLFVARSKWQITPGKPSKPKRQHKLTTRPAPKSPMAQMALL